MLDVAGPFEGFSIARLHEERRREESSPFRVLLVSEDEGQVTGVGGFRFTPDFTIINCPDLDILVVPGGWGTRKEVNNEKMLGWIADRSRNSKLIFTSAGISAGIDLALRIVSHSFGIKIGEATARHMEYPYPISVSRK